MTVEASAPPSVIAGGGRLRRAVTPRRQASYDHEVAALIVAAQTVMRRAGRSAPPRVADIVAEAGVSNQAFYRHFRSRDDLIVATYEQGLMAINAYLERQMYRYTTLDDRVGAWIDGVLAQIADTALSELSAVIIWNLGQIDRSTSVVRPVGRARMIDLLRGVLADADVTAPGLHADFIATLVLGLTTTCLESGERLTDATREHLHRFCLSGIGHRPS